MKKKIRWDGGKRVGAEIWPNRLELGPIVAGLDNLIIKWAGFGIMVHCPIDPMSLDCVHNSMHLLIVF